MRSYYLDTSLSFKKAQMINKNKTLIKLNWLKIMFFVFTIKIKIPYEIVHSDKLPIYFTVNSLGFNFFSDHWIYLGWWTYFFRDGESSVYCKKIIKKLSRRHYESVILMHFCYISLQAVSGIHAYKGYKEFFVILLLQGC